VLPFDSQRPRRARRNRRRPAPLAPESLEGRQLLAYSPLGFSLPDLVVSGQAPPVAAYGGPLTVAVDVFNEGQSSLIEPLNQPQGFPSHADAGPTVVGVYLSPNPRVLGPGAIRVGEIPVNSVAQASVVNLTATFVLPDRRPMGFPGNGGQFYVYFRADDRRQLIDADRTNNVSRAPQPVQLAAALPEIVAEAIEVPPVMQPGDFINPSIKIANLGTVPIGPQGPLLVQLVASTDQDYGPTDVVLASYLIQDMAPLSTVPVSSSFTTVIGEQRTIDQTANELILTGPTLRLPPGPAKYFIGVAVDPLNTIREISEIGTGPNSRLELDQDVGPPIPDLSPAGQVAAPAPPLNDFPIPPFGPIISPFIPAGTLIIPITTTGATVSAAVATSNAPTAGGTVGVARIGAFQTTLPPADARFENRLRNRPK
jgi:hypothetical protein